MADNTTLNVAVLAGPVRGRRKGTLLVPPVEARYLAALLREAAAQDPSITFRVLADADGAALFQGLEVVQLPEPGIWPAGRGFICSRALRRLEPDLVIAPFRLAPYLPWNVRAVLFGADMLDWPLPLQAAPPPKGPQPSLKRAVVRNAIDYFGPSRAFQKRFAELFDVGFDRISVIPPGLPEPAAVPASGPVVAPPYVVYLLNRHTREFWPAFLRFRKKHADLLPGSLVVVGDRPFPEDGGDPEDLGPMLWLEQCPQAYLERIFADAAVVCWPAREDYAGLDLLCALRAGARILAVRSGAAVEWDADALAFCDPAHEPSLARAVRMLLDESPDMAARRAARERRAVESLRWADAAWKLITLLRRHAA